MTREAAGRHADLVAAAEAAGTPVHLVSGAVMSALSQTVTPQGVVAVCALHRPAACRCPRRRTAAASRCWPTPATPATPARSSARPTRPARMRSCSPVTASTPTTASACAPRRAACSTCRWPSAAGWRTTLPALRSAGLRVLAADGHADLDLDAATDAGLLDGPTAWVFGNEAWGLPDATRALCRRGREGADPRSRRVAQPRDRRRGVPLRLGARPPQSAVRLTRRA